MNTPIQQKERGQAIVLMILTIIGLLGFAAVALDGGNIYTEQRRAQAAADNAVIAAAFQRMSNVSDPNTLRQAALTSALQNGYNNDAADNWVEFNTPPTRAPYAGQNNYFEIVITREVPTVLAHFVYRGPWQVTVHAVAKAVLTDNPIPYSGQAIMSVSPSTCQALWFHGTGNLDVSGAGIFSNSECAGTGPSSSAGVANGHGSVNIIDGNFGVAGTNIYQGGSSQITSNLNPVTAENQPALPGPTDLPVPTDEECGPNRTVPGGNSKTLDPGTYASTFGVGSNDTVYLRQGIYCFGGGWDKIQGDLSTELNDNGVQDANEGVLLYFYSSNEPLIDITAQAAIVLWALDSGTWKGMLMYAPEACGDVEINGGGDSKVTGTIYTPCSDVQINGNSGTFALESQIIANTVDIAGTGGVDIIYDPDVLYSQPIPPATLLVK